jgi:hypothetical protein
VDHIEAAPSAAKSVVAAVGVVLLGIVIGRLALERTGTGLLILAAAIPVVFIVISALFGIGRAAVLLGVFLSVAFLVKIILTEGSWLVLLLAPAIGLSSYMLANVLKAMAAPKLMGKREGKEEE